MVNDMFILIFILCRIHLQHFFESIVTKLSYQKNETKYNERNTVPS
jgi:hypothetical protein